MSSEAANFPFCRQLALIHRTRHYLSEDLIEEGWINVACSRPARQCTPREMLDFSRGHWTVESVHGCRDRNHHEDAWRIGDPNTARICATLHILAADLLGRRMGSRKNTRRRQQKRICRHPGIAVRLIVE